jgi:DNA repair exonuclease SbcCD ATPase subunit
VIQSTLFFILGFLSAGFLALIVAPAVWRRAVALTRKRIEASMPLTLNEMQAQTDSVRAEAAMTIRRLEITVKSLKEKTAEQLVEINRSREELKRLAGENAQKHHGNADKLHGNGQKAHSLAGFEAKAPELHSLLQKREQQIETLTRKLGEADNLIAKRAAELDQLGKMYEEVSFVSSSRQIELAGAEEEIERLSTDMSRLRSQRKDAEQRLQEIAAENQVLEETLKTERKRMADMERKTGQMTAMPVDREESPGHREKELARLQNGDGAAGGTANGLDFHLAEVQTASAILQAELAETFHPPAAAAAPAEETTRERVAKLLTERDRLERRLTTFAGENRKLRASPVGSTREGVNGIDGNSGEDDALLREQIHELAAEVVTLTAILEGPDSPIRQALAMPSVDGPSSGGPQEKITSLADRVRALQKAAAGD